MKSIKLLTTTGMVWLGLLVLGVAYAKGLSVSPASYSWENVEVGELKECPASMMVKNDSSSARSYTLRAVSPEELQLKPKEGYKALPQMGWVSFEQKMVTIGSGEWKGIKMFINIPEDKEHYGRKWEFFLEIKEYPDGQILALACYSRIFIITEGAGFPLRVGNETRLGISQDWMRRGG